MACLKLVHSLCILSSWGILSIDAFRFDFDECTISLLNKFAIEVVFSVCKYIKNDASYSELDKAQLVWTKPFFSYFALQRSIQILLSMIFSNCKGYSNSTVKSP